MARLPVIWVISLNGSTRRQTFVAETFRGLGIPFEFVPGIDGSALTPVDRATYSHARALLHIGRGLTEGELGCSLAHLKLYDRMLSAEVSEAVIFEDDARPTESFLDILRDAHLFPDDWDVVTFCSQFPESAKPAPTRDLPLASGHRICTYRRMPFGAQCYLIRLPAARRLLEVGYPVCMPTDELILRRYPAHLRVYGIEPRPVVPAGLVSELEARPAPPRTPRFAMRCVERPIVWTGKARSSFRRARDRLADRVEKSIAER